MCCAISQNKDTSENVIQREQGFLACPLTFTHRCTGGQWPCSERRAPETGQAPSLGDSSEGVVFQTVKTSDDVLGLMAHAVLSIQEADRGRGWTVV